MVPSDVDRKVSAVVPSIAVLKELNRRASGFAYDKLVAPRRGAHPAAKHLRNLASIANELLGRPLRPVDEAPLSPAVPEPPAPVVAARTPAARQAPVLVYFDGKDHRTLARVEDLLRGRGHAYQVLDVSADEAERSWATTVAKTSEFPLVFVAAAPVGGWDALLQADVSGELGRLIAAG
jgi:glutaredoxin-related protein